MTIPALAVAKADHALRGAPIIVYLHLLDSLDPVTWRPVKQAAMASRLAYSDRTISEALDLLVERGYLEAGDRKPGEARLYRLVYSKMP